VAYLAGLSRALSRLKWLFRDYPPADAVDRVLAPLRGLCFC